MIDATYYLYTLLVSNALILAAATIAILRMQRMLRNPSVLLKAISNSTAVENAAETAVVNVTDDRIVTLQKTVDELVDREKLAQSRTTNRHVFDSAMRMTKHGAKLDEITEVCGLSRAEAQLMMRVHARPPLKNANGEAALGQ